MDVFNPFVDRRFRLADSDAIAPELNNHAFGGTPVRRRHDDFDFMVDGDLRDLGEI